MDRGALGRTELGPLSCCFSFKKPKSLGWVSFIYIFPLFFDWSTSYGFNNSYGAKWFSHVLFISNLLEWSSSHFSSSPLRLSQKTFWNKSSVPNELGKRPRGWCRSEWVAQVDGLESGALVECWRNLFSLIHRSEFGRVEARRCWGVLCVPGRSCGLSVRI